MKKQEQKGSRSGSETRQRGGQIAFRVTPEERAEIEAAADRLELTVGSFIRAKILKKAQTRTTQRPSLDRQMLARALGLLGKAGSNLNQIAKHLNSGGKIESNTEIFKALSQFSELREVILKAIGGLCDSQGQEQASRKRARPLPDEEGRE